MNDTSYDFFEGRDQRSLSIEDIEDFEAHAEMMEKHRELERDSRIEVDKE